ARGFDVDLKGKPFLKRQKNFPPNKKQNNKLFAELAALQVNLAASGSKTPAGLGVLIYSDPGSSLDGMTIDEIAAYADTEMTKFEFQPLGLYTELDSVVGKINAAFYNAATDDTANGWASPKLTWTAYKSVYEVSYLKPNPGATPVNRRNLDEPEAVPTDFALYQNYPNPFNPTTTIEFDIPDASIVTLKIYNLLGQEVATLLDRESIDFGDAVEFDASSLPSGVYLYRIVAETIADADAGIEASTFTQVKKMVLVK
ncbi:MAG TPA: T9SS type A sorting domain-containing protein, partial [Bacteroidota bacterium]|nr:T9SS type A sorting domain-containing protein [Bacteroidota bacterium]